MTQQWIVFAASSIAIVLAGIRLAPYGEAIGRHTGIGQGWIGLLFLATLTSIPEMTTTVTGAMIGAPNIAVGNAFGSNLFNVGIIAVLDVMLLRRRDTFFQNVQPYHVLSGGVAVLLTLVAVLGMVVRWEQTWLGISPFGWMILAGYVAGAFLLFQEERRQGKNEQETDRTMSLRRAVGGFTVCAGVVVVSGIFLIRAGNEIAASTGLSSSLMGAIVVAVITSLPELAASVGALRMGAYNMVLGNLFGSNMFNILTIFFADAAFRSGPILSGLKDGAGDQILVAVSGAMLTTMAVLAVAARSRKKILGIGVDALLLGAAYVTATALIISRGV